MDVRLRTSSSPSDDSMDDSVSTKQGSEIKVEVDIEDVDTSSADGNDSEVSNWEFHHFIILLAFSYVKDDVEVFMLYFLFAGTSYGCHFDEAFGIALYSMAIVQIVAQPVMAWTTDRYEDYSTFLLWLSLFIEGVIEILMFAIPGQPFYSLLVLQLLRNITHAQNTDSIWKVFKQKLWFRMGENTLAHDRIISHIGMWGIAGSVALDTIIFGLGYLLSSSGYDFFVTSYYIYAMTVGLTFVACAIAYFIFTPAYVVSSRLSSETLDHPSPASEMEMNAFGTDDADSPSASPVILDVVNEVGLGKVEEGDEDACPYINFGPINLKKYGSPVHHGLSLGHFKAAFVHVWRNVIALGGLIHAALVCLVWKIMSGAEPLQIANHNVEANTVATVSNMCAGSITNLFAQYTWNNVIYIVGALGFLFGLVYVRPYMYFKTVYPITAVVFALCTIPLLFDVPFFAQVSLASVVGVLPWYLYRYDEYLIYSASDTKYLGVVAGIVGYIRYMSPAASGLILLFELDWLILGLTLTLLCLSAVFSVYFASRHASVLAAVSAPHRGQVPEETTAQGEVG